MPYEKVGKNEPVCIADEVPFDIPDSWEWTRLGQVIILLSGTDFKPSEYNDRQCGIPYITGASSLSDSGVIENRWTETPRVIANRGDVLLVCKGSGYGKTVICDIEEAHIARQIMAIKNQHTLNMDYVRFFLQSCFDQIKAKGQGVIPGIDRSSVLSLLFPLPPLHEQKRIVAKLLEVIPIVDVYGTKERTLYEHNAEFPVQLKKSILQCAVQGRLVPQDPNDEPASILLERIRTEKQRLVKEGKIKKDKHESIIFRRDNSHYEKRGLEEVCIDEKIPFETPESWNWVRLGNIIQYQNGYAYKSSDMNKSKRGYPVIKSGNLMSLEVVLKQNNDYVENPNEKMLESVILKGDMLMCLSSQSDNPEPLGKTAVYKIDTPALLNQRVLKLRPICEKTTQYLYYVINSEYFHYTVSHYGGGSAQANLKLEHVLNMLIPIPPLEEQMRIISQIERLLSKVSTL